MVRYPLAFSEALNSAVMILYGLTEVVISGKKESSLTAEMRSQINRKYLPGLISAFRSGEGHDPVDSVKNIPFQKEGAAAFICRKQTCSEPVTAAAELETLLTEK
jgi:uncharacterized protein YyaL (SSP411 family)